MSPPLDSYITILIKQIVIA